MLRGSTATSTEQSDRALREASTNDRPQPGVGLGSTSASRGPTFFGRVSTNESAIMASTTSLYGLRPDHGVRGAQYFVLRRRYRISGYVHGPRGAGHESAP